MGIMAKFWVFLCILFMVIIMRIMHIYRYIYISIYIVYSNVLLFMLIFNKCVKL